MESTIRLFRAVPIESKKKGRLTKKILERTIGSGFIFTKEVIGNHTAQELERIITDVEKIIGLSGEQANSSFHKSWQKIKEASIEQLFIEQIIHYFTTYGLERMGLYDENFVYIPNEELEIPEVDEKKIKLVLIRGYTKEELKDKLVDLLRSGVALGENTINDVVDVATYIELKDGEIEAVKNKEVRAMLYDYLNRIPANPTEFLRYAIYKATGKTLLIKDAATIEEIKSKKNLDVLSLFIRYRREQGLEELAKIFYRFKPLFLAFKTNTKLKTIINKTRKLARTHHKPMPEDYLNTVTAKIKDGQKISKKKLEGELSKVNTFRKIRLAYALKYRTEDAESILYKIRSGRGWATEFAFEEKGAAKKALGVVLDSIIGDLAKNVKGKRVYIPKNIFYALPATEKQFTGVFPSGTYIKVPKDMIVGVHWDNTTKRRIDLDLALIAMEGKYGWDASYRDEDRNILFSGDMTDARKPNGASELFYVKRHAEKSLLVSLNYYNFDPETEVPIKTFVAQEVVRNMKKNYTVNPNNIMATAEGIINQKQKILGLLVTAADECRFYFSEVYLGRSITSSDSEFAKNCRKYLEVFYKNPISLNELLEKAGAKLSGEKSCDINLAPEKLEKDSILKLLVTKKWR